MRANGNADGHSIVVQASAAMAREVRDTLDVAFPLREMEQGRLRGEQKPVKGTRHPRYLAGPDIQAPPVPQERLHCLLQTVQTVLAVDRVTILLADPGQRWLQSVASLGNEEPLEAIRIPIGPEGGAPAQAYCTQQAVAWDGRSCLPEAFRLQPPFDRIEAFRSRVFASVPVLVQGRAIGVLWVDRKLNRSPLDAATRKLLHLFAGQAALVIENGWLRDDIRRLAAIQLEAKADARTRRLQAANAELRAANLRLEAATRHTSQFLADMSHELKTPLNAILMSAELLKRRAFGPLTEKQVRCADNIDTCVRHALALIWGLLDLSKVEAGRLPLRLEAFVLQKAVAAVLCEIRPLVDTKGLTVVLRGDETPIALTADPVRFRQILYNLFANAVKFTPAGGRITMTLRRVPGPELQVANSRSMPETAQRERRNPGPGTADMGEFVEIAVADSGIGIKRQDLPKLFHRFRQLGPFFAEEHQGSGLGLAITRKFVELHGGTIRGESRGVGQGSTFTVRLPLVPHLSTA